MKRAPRRAEGGADEGRPGTREKASEIGEKRLKMRDFLHLGKGINTSLIIQLGSAYLLYTIRDYTSTSYEIPDTSLTYYNYCAIFRHIYRRMTVR